MSWMRIFPFAQGIIIVAGLAASLSAASNDILSEVNERVIDAQRGVAGGGLTNREIALLIGAQPVQQDIIDLLQEHVRAELASGKPREIILVEIREAFKRASNPRLSASDWAVIAGAGLVGLVGGFFAAKFIYELLIQSSSPEAAPLLPLGSSSVEPGITAVPKPTTPAGTPAVPVASEYHDDEASDTFDSDEELDLRKTGRRRSERGRYLETVRNKKSIPAPKASSVKKNTTLPLAHRQRYAPVVKQAPQQPKRRKLKIGNQAEDYVPSFSAEPPLLPQPTHLYFDDEGHVVPASQVERDAQTGPRVRRPEVQAVREGEESGASIPPTPLEGEEERSAGERDYVSETEASDSDSRRPASLRGSPSPSRVLVPASPVEERGSVLSASREHSGRNTPVYDGDDEEGADIPFTQPSLATSGSQHSGSAGSPRPSPRRNSSPPVGRDYSVSPELIPAPRPRNHSSGPREGQDQGVVSGALLLLPASGSQ